MITHSGGLSLTAKGGGGGAGWTKSSKDGGWWWCRDLLEMKVLLFKHQLHKLLDLVVVVPHGFAGGDVPRGLVMVAAVVEPVLWVRR